nr:MAG TPA: 30S ribosomal protein S2 [Caudoviricetes sp.]
MLSIFLSYLTHGGCRPTKRQPPNSKQHGRKSCNTNAA